MPTMTDIGPRGYKRVAAAATASYSPPFDRESIVDRVLIQAPSATDDFTFTVAGKELFRLRIDTVGNNQLPGGILTGAPLSRDLFSWYEHAFGQRLTIPIPRGQSLTVASVGGATADIFMEYRDQSPGTVQAGMINHYMGSNFTMPITARINTAVAAAGLTPFDTITKPAWVTNPFTGAPLFPGMRATLRALFIEAQGRNTFNGSADHRSTTQYFYMTKEGETMFTHDAEGIPLEASLAATGSANSVFSKNSQFFPAFQLMSSPQQCVLDVPIVFNPGDQVATGFNISGDVTGNADYSHALVVGLFDIQTGVS